LQTTEVRIVNRLGLHARAAAKLVSLASTFESSVELEKEGRRINAKSIMGVMMLAASQGTTVSVHVDGPDEDQAKEQIVALFASYFGEGE
jgi:phosphocarrier protein